MGLKETCGRIRSTHLDGTGAYMSPGGFLPGGGSHADYIASLITSTCCGSWLGQHVRGEHVAAAITKLNA